MATLAPLGRYYAPDTNGDPLEGGKVYTYEAGTTTPKATYTAQDESVENTNPVILGDDGMKDIWLGDGGYKFVVTDSADVEIFTTDNIGGSSDATFGGDVNTLTTNTQITDIYANSVNIATAVITLSLQSVSGAGEGFYFSAYNRSGGNLTIEPDGAETINGGSSLVIGDGESALIICNGTTWYGLFLSVPPTLGALATEDTVSTALLDDTAVTFVKLNSSALGVLADLNAGTASKLVTCEALKSWEDSSQRGVMYEFACALVTGSTGAVLAESGIATCVRNSTGTYTLTFDTAQADTNYFVMGLAETTLRGNVLIVDGTKTVNGCQIETSDNSTGAPSDMTTFNVIFSRIRT